MPSFPEQPPAPRPLLPAAADEPPRLTARTLDGLEWLLAAELEAAGGTELRVGRRTVEFSGSTETLYRAVLESRTAIRVLEPLGRFAVDSPESLYGAVASIDWPAQLKPTQTLRVDAVVHDSFVSHSLYAAQVVKDAVVDRLRAATGRRPNVQLHGASLRLALHLAGGTATLFRDAAGQSLHQRGWRQGKVEAPLSEVLAAGILGLAGWQPGEPLLDPFCGSGTLVIEAATQAAGIAPGLLRARRKGHGFFRFADCDRQLVARIVAELEARVVEPAGRFQASDLDPAAVAAARESAAAAGLADFITVEQRHFEEVVPTAEPGLIVTNPPYGERLPVARAAAIFRRLGDWLKLRCGGWRAAVLAPAATAKAIGLKPHRRLPLANGPIDCRLVELVVRQRTELPPSPAEAEPGGTAAAVPDSAHLPAAGRTVADQLGDFRRRLAKRAKHLGRWARRQAIEAYRLYDRDIPEIPLVIDRYGDYLHAAEYERPHDRTAIEHDVWLDRMVEAAAAELGVAADRVFLKTRRRQRAGGQYEKVDDRQATLAVAEAGLQFEVNLSDYLDTGLFLDHRPTRALVRGEAAGRRLLNLFCYTGSFSVAAAAGKAATTTSLDLSNTYLDWTRRNLAANGFVDRRRHELVRDDARAFLEHRLRRGGEPFDLVVVDPPTYSRSAKAATDWDVQRDHADLLELVADNLAAEGVVYFSTNFRRFRLDDDRLARRYAIREITRQTIPEDFRNARIHRSWRLVKRP
jgi:23S rRNA (guanine2445-N2)-methyltransferase / 23S rRNA (guanine2069-N7)-methyltransferase